MSEFVKGVIAGAAGVFALVLVAAALRFFNKRDKAVYEFMEREAEIEKVREGIDSRDPREFLDEVPGVRGAADGGIERFNRRRDEILHRSGTPGND
jgi:hypothetical protein